jgi:hypothetical protein
LLESCAGEHSHAIGRPIALKIGLVIYAPMFWFPDPDGNALLIVEPT